MSLIDRDLLASAASALVCAAVVVLVKVDAVRAVFAVPLCLLLPGYAITAATFVRPRLSGQRVLMLTLALSLATLVLGAVLLDAVPGGLRLASWTILLLVVVLGALAVAGVRRGGRSATGAGWRPRARPADVLYGLLALVLIGGALVLSRWPLPAKNVIGYAQLWMLSNGTPSAPSVQIGVTNEEQHRATYKIELVTGSGKPSIVEPALTLAPGRQRAITVPLTGIRGPQTIVTAELFRNGSTSVDRRVTALVAPPPGTGGHSAGHHHHR